MGQWVIRGWMGVIVVLLAVMYHTQSPLISLRCPPSSDQERQQYPPEQCAAPAQLIIRSVSDFWIGTAQLIDENKDRITAVSTLIIAVFTFTLWRATNRLWRSAENELAAFHDSLAQAQLIADRQIIEMRDQVIETGRTAAAMSSASTAMGASARTAAKALVELERPWIFLHLHPSINNGEDFERDTILWVEFDIANYGRFPADIIECWAGFGAAESPNSLLTLRDEFHDAVAPGLSAKDRKVYLPWADEQPRFASTIVMDATGNDETIFYPETGPNEEVFFYIRILYIGTDKERRFETRRCWRWTSAEWVRYSDDDYNYRT